MNKNLHILDTIPEQSGEYGSSGSLKLEVPKLSTENVITDFTSENFHLNSSDDSSNASTVIPVDNSFLLECEKKLLEQSSSNEENNRSTNKNEDRLSFTKLSRDLGLLNETISTPPNELRQQINCLRDELAECHEFHDLEIQILKENLEEKTTDNYLPMIEKYTALMELYANLKKEYEDYRNEQEKLRDELHFKTTDCLETLCSQIEASDSSLTLNDASFVSFGSEVKNSTMIGNISEREITLINNSALLANDPLATTTENAFSPHKRTPLSSKRLIFQESTSSTTKKRLSQELRVITRKSATREAAILRDICKKQENAIHINTEQFNKITDLEIALCDKQKTVEDLEQRLIKVEDILPQIQNEFFKKTDTLNKENALLKESVSKKTEQLNVLTEKLITETAALKPSLKDSLTEKPTDKILYVFIETIMESCRGVQEELIKKYNVEKTDWENQKEVDRVLIENLQNQIKTLKDENSGSENELAVLNGFKEECENLKTRLAEAEAINSMKDEEILSIRSLDEDKNKFLMEHARFQADLKTAEIEKSELLEKCKKLDEMIVALQSEIKAKDVALRDLEVLSPSHEEMKQDNEHLRQLIKTMEETLTEQRNELNSANEKLSENEKLIGEIDSLKKELESANEKISSNEKLLDEIDFFRNELNSANEKLSENEKLIDEIDSLKKELESANEKIANNEKVIDEINLLQTELESANKKIVSNEKLIDEIDSLKNELISAHEKIATSENLIAEIDSLKKELESANEKIATSENLIAEIDSLKKELESANEKIANNENLNDEIDFFKNELNSASERITKKRNLLDEMGSLKNEYETGNVESINEFNSGGNKNAGLNGIFEAFCDIKESIADFYTRNSINEMEADNLGVIFEEVKLEKFKLRLENVFGESESATSIMTAIAEIISECCKSSRSELETNKKEWNHQKANDDDLIVNLRNRVRNLEFELETCERVASDSAYYRYLLEMCKNEAHEAYEFISKLDKEVKHLKSLLSKENKIREDLSLAQETITELNRQLTVSENEKKEIAQRCENLEETLVELETEIECREADLENLKKCLSTLEKVQVENTNLKSSIEEWEEKIRSLKEELNANEILLQEMKSLKNECDELKNIIEALRDSKESIADVYSNVSFEGYEIGDGAVEVIFSEIKPLIENLIGELKSATFLSIVNEVIFHCCKSSWTELKKELENNRTEWNEQKKVHEVSIKNLENQLKTLRDENTHYENVLAELNDFKKECENLKSRLAEAEAINSMKDEEIRSIRSEDEDKNKILMEHARFQSDLKTAEIEKSEMMEKCKKLDEMIVALESEIKSKDVALRDLEVLLPSHEEMKQDNENFKQLIKSLEEMLTEQKNELNSANEKLSENEKLIGEIDSLKKELESANEKISSNEKLLDEIDFFRNELNSANEKLSENEKLIDEIDSLKKELESANEKIASNEKLIDEIDFFKNELISANEKLAENEKLIDEIDSLKNKLNSANEKLSENEKLIDEIDFFKNELISANEKLAVNEKLIDEIDSLKNELNSAKEKLSCNENLIDEIHSLKIDLDSANEKIIGNENLINEIDFFKNELNLANEKLAENEKLIDEIHSLKNELDSANEKLASNEKLIIEMESVRNENAGFKSVFEALHKSKRSIADYYSNISFEGNEIKGETIGVIFGEIKPLLENLFGETESATVLSIISEVILECCKISRKELRTEFENNKVEWNKQREFILALEAEVKTKNVELKDLEETVTEQKNELVSASEKLAWKEKLISEFEEDKIEWRKQKEIDDGLNRNLRNQVNLLKGEIKTCEGVITDLRYYKKLWEICKGEIDEAHGFISKLEEEISTLKSRLSESGKVEEDLSRARKIIAELNSQLQLGESERKEIVHNCLKLEDAVRILQSDMKSKESILKNLQKSFTSLNEANAENERLKISLEESEKTIAELRETLSGAEEKLIAREVSNREFEEKIRELREKLSQAEEKLISSEASMRDSEETVARLKEELNSIKISSEESEGRIRALTEKLSSAEEQLISSEVSNREYEEEIRALTEKLSSAKEKLISNEAWMKEAEEEIMESREKLSSAEKELNSREVLIRDLTSLKNENEGFKSIFEKLREKKKWIASSLFDSTHLKEIEMNLISEKTREILDGFQTEKDIGNYLSAIDETIFEFFNSFRRELKKFDSREEADRLRLEMENLRAENDKKENKLKELTRRIDSLREEREDLLNASRKSKNFEGAEKSHKNSSSSSRNVDLCFRRLDKLEEINQNLTDLITKMLNETEFENACELKFMSVRDHPKIVKKIDAHISGLKSRMKELEDGNAQLDRELDSYAEVIKGLQRDAAAVWKSNKEKSDSLNSTISMLREEKKKLEAEKEELIAKVSRLDGECKKLKSSTSEESTGACNCGNELKKIHDLKRTILIREQKIMELQDLENQNYSFKAQIKYLENALEQEKKKIKVEKEKCKTLQTEIEKLSKNDKPDKKTSEENQMLEELRLRGSVSGGVVQEFVDKEKMRKLAKDIGILKELCRARYVEIKRLETENASLKRSIPKNSNQLDSPLRVRSYNTRSKLGVKEMWKSEADRKENCL